MARSKKNRQAEDPGLNLGSATAVLEPEEEVVEAEPAPEPETDAEGMKAVRTSIIAVVAPSLNRPKESARLEEALARCNVPYGWTLRVNVHREPAPRALPIAVNDLVDSAVDDGADIVVVLADHIVPDTKFLESIIRAFRDKFPGLDGMVGLNIVNMPPSPGIREYCFFALGRKFIERFPDCEVLCPDYHHFFGDTELGQFASSIEAFHFAQDAKIETHHVNNGLAQKDATWAASRSRKDYDVATWQARQARGLLWGKTFERVNP